MGVSEKDESFSLSLSFFVFPILSFFFLNAFLDGVGTKNYHAIISVRLRLDFFKIFVDITS